MRLLFAPPFRVALDLKRYERQCPSWSAGNFAIPEATKGFLPNLAFSSLQKKTEQPFGNPAIFSSLRRPVAYRPRLAMGLAFYWDSMISKLLNYCQDLFKLIKIFF
jgi:hypothetical protein